MHAYCTIPEALFCHYCWSALTRTSVEALSVTGGQAQGQEERDTMMDTVHQLDQNDGFITFLNKTLQYGADPNNWGHKF